MQHSYELGRLEEKTRVLAEEVALLNLRLEQLTPADAPGPVEAAEDDDLDDDEAGDGVKDGSRE